MMFLCCWLFVGCLRHQRSDFVVLQRVTGRVDLVKVLNETPAGNEVLYLGHKLKKHYLNQLKRYRSSLVHEYLKYWCKRQKRKKLSLQSVQLLASSENFFQPRNKRVQLPKSYNFRNKPTGSKPVRSYRMEPTLYLEGLPYTCTKELYQSPFKVRMFLKDGSFDFHKRGVLLEKRTDDVNREFEQRMSIATKRLLKQLQPLFDCVRKRLKLGAIVSRLGKKVLSQSKMLKAYKGSTVYYTHSYQEITPKLVKLFKSDCRTP